mgnify:CR=1 FL=1
MHTLHPITLLKALRRNLGFLCLALVLGLSFTACSDDDDDNGNGDTTPTPPETYAGFDNVSYSGQTTRLNQLEELTTYMKNANSEQTVDAQTMKDMYRNDNDPFSFTADKELLNKTFAPDTAQFLQWMDEFAAATQAMTPGTPGSNGTPGVVTSNDGNKQYFFDANGMEHIQLIEKGLMGAVFYYQIAEVYTREGKIGAAVDNSEDSFEEGRGTDKEHHFDEAYGYLGVPPDFPNTTDGARFYGKYCNGRDGLIGSNQAWADAFTACRFAISQKMEQSEIDQRAAVCRREVERVIAGTAIHYLNGGINNFADDALRNHELSEAIAFVRALKYNADALISQSQIDDIIDNKIGANLYEVDVNKLEEARDELAQLYDLEDVKTDL